MGAIEEIQALVKDLEDKGYHQAPPTPQLTVIKLPVADAALSKEAQAKVNPKAMAGALHFVREAVSLAGEGLVPNGCGQHGEPNGGG